MIPAAPPPDTLGRLRALEAHVLTLGARSPLLAAWVEKHGILDETRQLFRDLPRVPYALLECPDALLYLGCVLDCWGQGGSRGSGARGANDSWGHARDGRALSPKGPPPPQDSPSPEAVTDI